MTSIRRQHIIGVDFSGAAEAGKNIWIARATVRRERLRLESLDRLGDLCGTTGRDSVLPSLVQMIRESGDAAWGIDFPFGLPIELGYPDWNAQLDHLRTWSDGAPAFGRHCVDIARRLGGKLHIRRACDVDTPFDCYHYRIIYQTFHGMRDVLAPLTGADGVCVLPFEVGRLRPHATIVAEACPGSTLRRLGLPFNNYKQTGGDQLDAKRRATRKIILEGLKPYIELSPAQIGRTTRNLGGDALDAVIAAVGVFRSLNDATLAVMRKDDRARREGYVIA
jgi:hypothetical protein